jgi:hypothetical protein
MRHYECKAARERAEEKETMTNAGRIKASCEKYSETSTRISNAVMLAGRYWTPEETAEFAAAEAELLAIMEELGFSACYQGADGRSLLSGQRAWEAKRIGHVLVTSGSNTPREAHFTAAKAAAASRQQLITRNTIRNTVDL